MTVSSTKNMAPRFEDTLPSGTNIVSVSADGGGSPDVAWRHRVHQRAYIIRFYFEAIIPPWRTTVAHDGWFLCFSAFQSLSEICELRCLRWAIKQLVSTPF